MDQKLPRLARCKNKGKITAYPEMDIAALYYMGKGNGWDTPKIVRDAITKALMAVAEDLRRPAG